MEKEPESSIGLSFCPDMKKVNFTAKEVSFRILTVINNHLNNDALTSEAYGTVSHWALLAADFLNKQNDTKMTSDYKLLDSCPNKNMDNICHGVIAMIQQLLMECVSH